MERRLISNKIAWRQALVVLGLCAPLGLLTSGELLAQKKKAVVILQPTKAADQTPCEGQTELKFLVIHDAKLNGKKDIQLLANIRAPHEGYCVSRDDFESGRPAEFKDLTKLYWQKGCVYGTSMAGAGVLGVPSNMKPDKKSCRRLGEFYGVLLQGEVREGRQKQKAGIPLRSIWKIFVVNETDAPDESLFQHASEEKDVGQWKAYLAITRSHRVNEAGTALGESLRTCALDALEKFKQGDCGAIQTARNAVSAAQAAGVIVDDLKRAIDEQEQKVGTAISEGKALSLEEKWDEALDVLKGVEKYLGCFKDLAATYQVCLEGSHGTHVTAGKQALEADQLEQALNHFEIALTRLANSADAKHGKREANIRITLRTSKVWRDQGRPDEAWKLVSGKLAEPDYRGESRLTEELGHAGCEWNKQLFEASHKLIHSSRPARVKGRPPEQVLKSISNPSDEKPFKEARERLEQAIQVCSDEDTQRLLATVNQQLSDHHIGQARNALKQRASGTAYLHLMAAKRYTPQNGDLPSTLEQARGLFQEKGRISLGVILRDRTSYRAGFSVAQQLESDIKSALLKSETSVSLLQQPEAEQVLRNLGSSGNAIIVSGEVTTCSIERTAQNREVPSRLVFANPAYGPAKDWEDALKKAYEDCRKSQGGEAACGNEKARWKDAEAQRKRIPDRLYESYSYWERDIVVQGLLKVSMRMDDSVSRTTQQIGDLEATTRDSCTERGNVQDNDERNVTLLGKRVQNNTCHLPHDDSYRQQLAAKVKMDAERKAVAALENFRLAFFKRAEKATNQDTALEDYITFAFISTNKRGSEFDRAIEAITSRDDCLKTDGNFR